MVKYHIINKIVQFFDSVIEKEKYNGQQQKLSHHLVPWFSKYGSEASGIGLTWKLNQGTFSDHIPHLQESDPLGVGPGHLSFNKP